MCGMRLSTCMKLRDHVFAILGLLDAEIRDQIAIDYSLTTAQIFTNVLEVASRLEDGVLQLPLLWEALSNIPAKTPDLPSWCPDFANEARVWRRPVTTGKSLSDTVSVAYNHLAGLRTAPLEGGIHVKVIALDCIMSSVNAPLGLRIERTGDLDDDQPCWLWLDHLHETMAEPHVIPKVPRLEGKSPLPDWGSAPGSFLWSFVLDQVEGLEHVCYHSAVTQRHAGSDSSIIECHYRQHYLKNSHFCLGMLLLSCHLTNPLHMIEGSKESMLVSTREPDSMIDLEVVLPECYQSLSIEERTRATTFIAGVAFALTKMLQGQFIFKTVNGRYGHSPKRPSPGDHICLVPGGKLLHIISADRSRYVTTASVHGLMDDDLLDLISDPEAHFEEIALY